MSLFAILQLNKEAIIQVETGALLHDLDKLEPAFLENPAYHSRPHELAGGRGRSVREIRGERWQRLVGRDQEIEVAGLDLNAISFAHDDVTPDRTSFGSIASAFIDHHENNATTYSLFAWLMHGGGSGSDGIDSEMDKTGGGEQEASPPVIDTPFGHKQGYWQDVRAEVRQLLDAVDFSGIERRSLFAALKEPFSRVLGETRYPCNDVTLWAHAFSSASLCKALLAKVLIEFSSGRFSPEKPYCMPQRTTKRAHNPSDFTFVQVAFDRDFFLSRAQKVGDIAGMTAQIAEIQDALRIFIEEELLVANQTYRDEERQLFLLPRLNTWFRDDGEVFPGLHERFEAELGKLLRNKIEELLIGSQCQNLPFAIDFAGSGNKPKGKVSERIIERSKELLGREADCSQSVRALLSAEVDFDSHSDSGRCEICGIRRISRDDRVARQQKLCVSCLARRRNAGALRRRNRKLEHTTTDLSRLLDSASGENRLVMLSLAFDLEKLHDGTLIFAIHKKDKQKQNPSPARLDRAYEILEDFFRRFQREVARICPDGLFPITLSPRRFELVVGAAYADQVIDSLYEMYNTEFVRVRTRLPLSLGAVFFYRKFPLYVVLETAGRLRRILGGRRETLEVKSNEVLGDCNHIRFHQPDSGRPGGSSVTSGWLLPAKLSNNLNDDNCYCYLDTVEAGSGRLFPKRADQLRENDLVSVLEGGFTFFLLDSAARRYLVKPQGIEHHLGGLRQPYRFSEWQNFTRIWGLLEKLDHSQISKLENELVAKRKSWGDHWRYDDPAIVRFCEMLLFAPNVFGRKDAAGRYRLLDAASNRRPGAADCDRKLLLDAATSGMLLDVIDFYMHLQNKEIRR